MKTITMLHSIIQYVPSSIVGADTPKKEMANHTFNKPKTQPSLENQCFPPHSKKTYDREYYSIYLRALKL